MKEEPVSDTLLRQFLLGNVDDQERQRLESLFVSGALSGERVMAAEQHLLDDFLENSLTPEDRERFLAQYGATPDEQRNLRIAKSIQEWAARQDVTVPKASRWSSVRERFWLKPAYMIPVAAVLLIAIVCAVLLNRSWEQQHTHLAMQQEFVRLNAPSMRDVSPATGPLTLTPGAFRSAEAENELIVPVNVDFVELRLIWRQERYPSYRATIRRHEEERFTVPDLQLDGSGFIRLRLPRQFLKQGLYLIEMSGVSGSVAEPAEEYSFVVRG